MTLALDPKDSIKKRETEPPYSAEDFSNKLHLDPHNSIFGLGPPLIAVLYTLHVFLCLGQHVGKAKYGS